MPFELMLSGLSKTYPNGVQALSGVSLTIPTGMFGLLGPNGAGKSTLMRTLATLQEADAGTARLGEIDVLRDKDAVRRTLGYLPQDFGVYPKVSAEEMLDHLARLKGLAATSERRDVVATLLKQTNLYDVRKKALGGFSGGMRQRFGIAQALLGNPRLIIVDEPTAGLDPEERVRFHNLLAEIGENVIVILSTHIVSDVSDLCARMAIIHKGRVLLTGEPQALTRALAAPRLAEGDRAIRARRDEGGLSGDLDAPRRRPDARQRRRRRRPRRGFAPRRGDAGGRLLRGDRRPASRRSGRAARRVMRNILTIAGVRIPDAGEAHLDVGLLRRSSSRWRCCGSPPPAARSRNAIVVFGSGKVWINSPYAIAQTVSFLGMVALTVIAAVMGRAVQQDFEYRSETFFFTAPIRKSEYLAGRFLGALAVLIVVLSSIAIGGVAGLLLPGIDPDRVGPFRLAAYVLPYLTVLLPNLVVLGGIFFCARRADAPDAAGLHRQRSAADRLSRRAGPAARHRQQDAGRDARSLRARRQFAADRILVDQRAQHAPRCRSKDCCCGTGCCGSRSAPRSSASARIASALRTREAPGKVTARRRVEVDAARSRGSGRSRAGRRSRAGQRLAPAAAHGAASISARR